MAYSTCNFTDEINENECIGDSLQTINTNFKDLEVSLCQAVSDIANLANKISAIRPGVQSLMNIRMSLSPSQAIGITDILSTTLYVHPYNGNAVTLWNTTKNEWETRQFNSILSVNLSQAGAQAPNSNYDVFLFYDESTSSYKVECVLWDSHVAGAAPPAIGLQDGVFVKPGQPNKRLIGCLRTTNTAGQTEISFGRISLFGGSYPKIYIWNLYNQEPASFSILETGTPSGGINRWTSTGAGDTGNTNGPFERFGNINPSTGINGNKVSFICREPQVVTLNSVHYVENNICYYFGASLDLETPTVAQLFQKTPGVPIYELCSAGNLPFSYTNTVQSGYHFVQMVSMTYSGQTQNYLTWTGDRHSYGTIGTISNY